MRSAAVHYDRTALGDMERAEKSSRWPGMEWNLSPVPPAVLSVRTPSEGRRVAKAVSPGRSPTPHRRLLRQRSQSRYPGSAVMKPSSSGPAPGSRCRGSARDSPNDAASIYFHPGDASHEQFALDGVAIEGAWPGPVDRWVDQSNLGQELFQVLDRGTNWVVDSRGSRASSATGRPRRSETKAPGLLQSVRFPAPDKPVQVVIKERGPHNEFREVWSVIVDPSDATVDRSDPPKLNVWPVIQNGPPRDKVDLLLLGDGYTASEMNKWHADAHRMAETLFAASPFKEHRRDFNVWAIDTPAEQSGVARPSDAVYRHSPLRAAYDAFGSERYVLRSTISGCVRSRPPPRTSSLKSW